MKLANDTKSLSTFRRDTARLIKESHKTKQPLVLTVNGVAAIVVQDVESYQELLDAKERLEAIEGIRKGVGSLKGNKARSADNFFAAIFVEHNIPEA